jgi:predicted PurR-regulated permease PerM
VPPERLVSFRARTILSALGVVLAVAAVLEVLWVARGVITWVFVALFLALAINPLVEWLQANGIQRRSLAVAVASIAVLGGIAALAATFVPILVGQVNDFVDAVPGYVDDITRGRGRLGFLQEDYHIVDRVREAIESGGAARVLGFSGTAIAVTKGVIHIVVATVAISFMTFFMLMEGPTWVERFYGLLPEHSQKRWRAVGRDVYRTVGGYVTGNLLISVIAGVTSTIVFWALGMPYAVALGLLVAILDLIPLAGATLAAIIVTTVGFLDSISTGVIVLVFFIVYQQIENHLLQPLVYGRTVQLSPLAVLISVLIGAELAGILGALGAIPVAGGIQVIVVDYLRNRRQRLVARPEDVPPEELPAPG